MERGSLEHHREGALVREVEGGWAEPEVMAAQGGQSFKEVERPCERNIECCRPIREDEVPGLE